MSDKSIVPTNPDDDWGKLVESLVAELAPHELPDKVVRATEMLLAGYPTYKVARKLGVGTDTVRRWISTYPTMAHVVAKGRELLSQWRMAKLEQQFLTAVERSQEILEVGLDGSYFDNGVEGSVNPKVLPVIAAQARYVIGLFVGQKQDIEIKHELGDTVLKARQDALSYLAEQLAAQQEKAQTGEEPIQITYTVIDPKIDATGPLLDEEGNPPFGEMGVLDRNEDGTLCHVCGQRFLSFARHISRVHNMSIPDFEVLYMLPEGSVKRDEREADGGEGN